MVGSFIFVLHSHVPYVRKSGKWPHGEEMLFEIIAETYVPLLNAFTALHNDGLKLSITVGLTPILLEQLNDKYMQREFVKYMQARIKAAHSDYALFKKERPEALDVCEFYIKWYTKILYDYEHQYNYDIIGAFKFFQDNAGLDIITSAATHGYLPLLSKDSAIWGQLKTGIKQYKKYFGRSPSGIWLPECGYRPITGENRKGIEYFLESMGINYFFTDTHVIESAVYARENNIPLELLAEHTAPDSYNGMFIANASATAKRKRNLKQSESPQVNTFYPYYVSDSNVYVFGRDEVTGMQVWSAEWGYPGDFTYREFHKKAPTSGIQYWKISNKQKGLKFKDLYNPKEAHDKTQDQANHFVGLVTGHLTDFYNSHGSPGVVVSSYDTELFGHWWFEGVHWIESVIRGFAREKNVQVISAREFTATAPQTSALDLPESSWGNGGHHSTWLNDETELLWKEIHKAEQRFEKIVHENKFATGIRRKILNQTARELLLLQSSDWPFLITTVQAKDYAEKRFKEFVDRFTLLCDFLEQENLDARLPETFDDIFDKDNVFKNIDFHDFL
jgi:1,4-alpha-glucan branching enzyme